MKIEGRFITTKAKNISLTTSVQIIVDKQTGVNYLYVGKGYGGGLTPLLDAEGKVVVTLPAMFEENT